MTFSRQIQTLDFPAIPDIKWSVSWAMLSLSSGLKSRSIGATDLGWLAQSWASLIPKAALLFLNGRKMRFAPSV